MPWRYVVFLLHLSHLVSSNLGKSAQTVALQDELDVQSETCEMEACLGRTLEDVEAMETRSLQFELLQKVLSHGQRDQRLKVGEKVTSTADTCNLCVGEQRWAFVLSSGRTGSTSILEMLNAIPGFYIAGENFGLLQHVQELYQNDDMQILMAGGNYSTASFYHLPISSNDVRCALQSYVKAMIGGFDPSTTSVIGFKEIRHHTAEELDFFLELFPCARIVINTRADTEALQESQNHTFEDVPNQEELQAVTDVLENWQAAHRKEAFLMRLEDFSLKRFNEMLAWLGVANCQYTSIAEDNTQFGYFPGRQRAQIDGECKIIMEI